MIFFNILILNELNITKGVYRKYKLMVFFLILKIKRGTVTKVDIQYNL